jgi:molybdopterin molybdotransferase
MTLISIRRARELVLEAAPTLAAERIPVVDALDRVLAEPVSAAGDVPPFACSAMDGYAVHAGPADRKLTLIGESRAGAPFDSDGPLGEPYAVRISTGAAVPDGMTAVIRQEDTEQPDEARVALKAAVEPGQNIRFPGEDMRAGATVIEAGISLTPAALGAAVAAGAGSVTVACQPRVSVLCTGDELREPGAPLGPGEIHNSNALMLQALVGRCGGALAHADILPDDREVTEQRLGAALHDSDVLVISGGVSVGPHDHVKPALASLSVQEIFWGVALQPGKPTWFGVAASESDSPKLVFGLPGNPVSAFVTFSLFARAALRAMQGAPVDHSFAACATLGRAVPRNPSREQAIRVRLEHAGATSTAVPTGPQDSHIVTSLLAADALAMIPAGEGTADAGIEVAIEPLVR